MEADHRAVLTNGLRNELAVSTLLIQLLGADLGRDILGIQTAIDASPEYGFGVLYTNICVRKVAVNVCSYAERRGDFVRFYPEQRLR